MEPYDEPLQNGTGNNEGVSNEGLGNERVDTDTYTYSVPDYGTKSAGDNSNYDDDLPVGDNLSILSPGGLPKEQKGYRLQNTPNIYYNDDKSRRR